MNLDLVKEDKRFVRVRNTYRTSELYSIDERSLLAEIETCQAVRVNHRLDFGAPTFINDLIRKSEQEQGYRARLTQIKFVAVRASADLRQSIAALKTYIMVQYHEQISSTFRTQTERKTFVESLFDEMNEFLANMDLIVTEVDLIVADIDKSGWSLKLMLDAYSIHTQRENRL